MRQTPRVGGRWNLVVALSIFLVLTTPVIGSAGGSDPIASPGPIVVASSEPTSISITWGASSDRKVTGYDVYWNGSFLTHSGETKYTAQGLECGTAYTVAVLAFDRAGNRSAPTSAVVATSACADTERPSAPSELSQAGKTASSIAVKWRQAPDNTAVAGYVIYVNDKPDGTTADSAYVADGLECGKSYTIGVEASDAAGNRSSRSSGVMSTSSCSVGGGNPHGGTAPGGSSVADAQPPSIPSGLAVSNLTATSLTLSWKASKDNVAVTGYDVYAGNGTVGTTIATSRDFSGLACGTSYSLGVEAFDAAGNRSSRATLPAVTTPTTACPAGGGTTSGTLFVSTSGSDSGTCTKTAPCATFARAYDLAAPGAMVEVAEGSYPVQTLMVDSGKSGGSDVVFRPAAGASVTLQEFISGDTKEKVGAKRFELRDFKISSYVRVRWGSEDVTLRNIDAGGLNLTSASRVKVLGGDYGPMVDGVSHINACGVSGCYPAEDILIDGALFHDYTITEPEKHSECIMIWPGRRVTIRNSVFRNCTDFDILVKPYNTGLVGLPGDITLENNFFDEPIIGDDCLCNRGGNAIGITQGNGENWSGAQVRYNSSLGGIRIDAAVSNAVIKGNIARKDTNYSCQSNISFSYNVWSGAKCSSTDRTAAFSTLFVGSTSSSFDLSLSAGSAAIGAGDPASYPSTDRKGTSRPQGGAPDAGADERA
ncbi:MAG: fibronectin type III domain-containing protein [Gaiellaceae bacterium MAG52_C11]|nr:fibronectin type III domain-containing protein [Candidatus Gaiellasilicea maunaloa]